jgi:hypothetical protein
VRHGYPSFGLTLTPYLIMSFVNLIGSLISPDYSHVYIVENEILIEAQKRHSGHFDGIIGKL